MTKHKTYKSQVLAVIHQTATDCYTTGIISKQTMQYFDKLCLTASRQIAAKQEYHEHHALHA